MHDSVLSTSDNPYNPFTHWDEWYAWDVAAGYNTCAYLARVANVSELLTDEENDAEIERAMDEIIQYNLTGKYIKVAQ